MFIREGRVVRPFSQSCGVKCRGYSRPLQRRITDFGADVSFNRIPEKLYEHYGLKIPYTPIRNITERHAEAVKGNEYYGTEIPERDGVGCIIGGTDGTMIPIVDVGEDVADGKLSDRRKTRRCRWKEARLMLAHTKGSVFPFFGCTLGGPDEAGDGLLNCAIHAGMGRQTEVHCIGDGAPWIADQIDRVFGSQAHFLIDYYHLCEYLSHASEACSRDDPSVSFSRLKKLMKDGKISAVLNRLKPYTESDSVPAVNAPVRRCCNYIMNRPGQFDYKGASENDLPIGSGEIESAHRYIIQKRMKIAGAWWKENNAENMISLRVLRANNQWESYWKKADQV